MMQDYRITANIPQSNFLQMLHKYRAFVSGFGGGKMVRGSMGVEMHHYAYPKVNSGYFAPIVTGKQIGRAHV